MASPAGPVYVKLMTDSAKKDNPRTKAGIENDVIEKSIAISGCCSDFSADRSRLAHGLHATINSVFGITTL